MMVARKTEIYGKKLSQVPLSPPEILVFLGT
jgi:hypothetical protein